MSEAARGSAYQGLQVLILGVSARAAAFSAVRAGFRPLAVDCFRDRDLAAVCDCVRIDRFPDGLEAAAEAFPPCPWLYTGGLENRPRLVDRMAVGRELLGNLGHVLREVRNPFRLAQVLRSDDLPTLDVSADPPDASSGRWLRKPRWSGGGRGIEFASSSRERDRAHYYQRYMPGTPCSAIFVGAEGKAAWLGATQQLIGTAWTGARGFEYAGSLGPLDIQPDQRRQWERIGRVLAERFGLSGLFGVDAVVVEGTVWVVEVNPRYTASVEVFELACGLTTMLPHVRACRDGELPRHWPVVPQERVGKAIIYARNPGRVPAGFDGFVHRWNANPARPVLADIPPNGSEFSSGEPVLTVLAHASSLAAVAKLLEQTVAAVQAALSGNLELVPPMRA